MSRETVRSCALVVRDRALRGVCARGAMPASCVGRVRRDGVVPRAPRAKRNQTQLACASSRLVANAIN